uniref:HIRA-interacting protein 3 n=1 Tax=Geotrypetes seraphini TaxID=260995 RepID=A0A6P8RG60_GEOSA|nr:HIRA-interacting protein 3 [Geotrypetes seraphini]
MAATDGVCGSGNTACDMRSFTQDLLRSSLDLSALTHSVVRKKYLAHAGRASLTPDERRQLREIIEDELLKVEVEDSDDNEPLAALVHSKKSVSSCPQLLPISTAMKENRSFDSDCQDRQMNVGKSPQKRKHLCSELDEDSGMDQKKPSPESAPRKTSKKTSNTDLSSRNSACEGEKFARNGKGVGGKDSSVEMEKGKNEVDSEEEMIKEEDNGLEVPPKGPEFSFKPNRARKRVSGHNQKERGTWRSSSSSSEEDKKVSTNKKRKAAIRNSSRKDRKITANKKRKAAMRNSSSSEEDRRISPTRKKETMRSSSSEEDRRISPTKKEETMRSSSSGEEDRRISPTKKEETMRSSSSSSSGEEDIGESLNKKEKAARQSSSEEDRRKRTKSSSCSENDKGKSPNKKGERTSSSSEEDEGKQTIYSSKEDQNKSLKKEKERRSSSNTKEKKGGGRSEAQKRHSQQGSSLDDSENASEEEEIQKIQRGKKDTKSGPACGKDEHPSIRRLKRCLLACGVRRNYKKLFEGKRSVKAKVEVLKRELADLGVKGNPTLEKCKIVRLKREEAAELASLDTRNIISTEGRLRRRNIWNPYQTPLDTSLGENYKRSVSDSDEGDDPPKKKRLMEWSNLKGIISESGDSD